MPAGEEGSDGPEAAMEGRGRVTLPNTCAFLHARAHTPADVRGHQQARGLHRHIHTDAGTHRDTRRSSLALLRGGAMDTDTGLSPAQRHKYMRTYFS